MNTISPSENEIFSNIVIRGARGSGKMTGPMVAARDTFARTLRRAVWSKLTGSRTQRKAKANALVRGGYPAVAKWMGQQMKIEFRDHRIVRDRVTSGVTRIAE